MKHLKIELDETVIMGCLDFVEQFDSIPDAIQRTLAAFTNAMRVKGKIPERSVDEAYGLVNEIMHKAIEDDDPLSVVDAMLRQLPAPTQRNMEDISNEVERRIESDSIPKANKTFTVIEPTGDVIIPPDVQINLFEQHRRSFAMLRQDAPKDRLIEQVYVMVMSWPVKYPIVNEVRTAIPLEERIKVAALEITYTFLPRELWGSLRAEEQIKKFINQHDGSES